jgi:hypothetical protein
LRGNREKKKKKKKRKKKEGRKRKDGKKWFFITSEVKFLVCLHNSQV